jgi:HlyD family secretion protein/adhesin transport system membrane fusion protein
MSVRTRKLGYLSESVLLEERGLPYIQSTLIIVVSLLILAFIIWANFLTIDDKVSIDGYVIPDEESYIFLGLAPTSVMPVLMEQTWPI